MPDIPFHVAGGAFGGWASRPPESFETGQRPPPSPPGAGSRRRRLWEVAHKCHCPIIGVCFGVDELRNLMARVMHFPRDASDFVLHTTAVGACEVRSPLSELLHKTLEKRFQLDTRRAAAIKDTAGLRALWQQATASGSGVAAALWTCWSHPACDKTLEQEIYGDIHMLQHQVGTGIRADLGALQKLQQENASLRRQLEEGRRETDALRSEKAREQAVQGERIAELGAELAGQEAWSAKLAGELATLRSALPDLRDRQALVRRASDAEARATALAAHAADLESELDRLHRLLERSERTLATVAAPIQTGKGTGFRSQGDLQGKCILCVGGRNGTVEAYREIVEQTGGRFLHHDGGLEESLHRIDSALAAADLVICQAGCISHNAYWRVKEQCKRTGKRCLYLKSAGASSFARTLASAVGEMGQPPQLAPLEGTGLA